MKPYDNPDVLSTSHGTAPIGVSQRTIAFTAIADAGGGLINITAAGHGLKKHQCFYISGGDYAGIHSVKKVVSANVIQVEHAFTATAAGNLELTAHKHGYGFYADAVPITIAEIEAENENTDTVAFIDTQFIAGLWYPFPFRKIRITAGDITVVRQPIRAELPYTNRLI